MTKSNSVFNLTNVTFSNLPLRITISSNFNRKFTTTASLFTDNENNNSNSENNEIINSIVDKQIAIGSNVNEIQNTCDPFEIYLDDVSDNVTPVMDDLLIRAEQNVSQIISDLEEKKQSRDNDTVDSVLADRQQIIVENTYLRSKLEIVNSCSESELPADHNEYCQEIFTKLAKLDVADVKLRDQQLDNLEKITHNVTTIGEVSGTPTDRNNTNSSQVSDHSNNESLVPVVSNQVSVSPIASSADLKRNLDDSSDSNEGVSPKKAKLEDAKNSTGSLLDDFADPCLEQPSYMEWDD